MATSASSTARPSKETPASSFPKAPTISRSVATATTARLPHLPTTPLVPGPPTPIPQKPTLTWVSPAITIQTANFQPLVRKPKAESSVSKAYWISLVEETKITASQELTVTVDKSVHNSSKSAPLLSVIMTSTV